MLPRKILIQFYLIKSDGKRNYKKKIAIKEPPVTLPGLFTTFIQPF